MGSKTMSVIRRGLVGVAGLAIVGLGAWFLLQRGHHGSTEVEASPPSQGYVVTYFETAKSFTLYPGDEDCPDGYNLGLQEITLAALPPGPEKDHLVASLPDRTFYAANHHSPEECVSPANYKDPAVHPVQGQLAYGMNLDGATAAADPGGADTCPHAKFRNPAGALVDNQFYRAVGCGHAYRGKTPYGGNLIEDQHQGARKDGEMTFLVELEGTGGPERDGDVTVGFYSSPDATPFDSQGRPIRNTSLSVTDNPRYRTIAHGRVNGGVLTTDPVDVRLYFNWVTAHNDAEEYYIRGARLRLELHPDGTAKGMLAGYWDVEKAYQTIFAHGLPRTELLASSFGYTCPSIYAALRQYADGYKDPATGACTAISTAFDVEAVSAFVIHSAPGKSKTADAR